MMGLGFGVSPWNEILPVISPTVEASIGVGGASAVAEDAGAGCSEVASLFPLQPTMAANARAMGSQRSFCLVIGFHPSLSKMNLSPAAETHRDEAAGPRGAKVSRPRPSDPRLDGRAPPAIFTFGLDIKRVVEAPALGLRFPPVIWMSRCCSAGLISNMYLTKSPAWSP